MLSTSERLLRVLTLLESRRDWSGANLAERLEVSTRAIRNDMVCLRTLGYPVGATPGVAGGPRPRAWGPPPPSRRRRRRGGGAAGEPRAAGAWGGRRS